MRRIVFTQTGGSDVLSLIEEPTPAPGPGEVLVRLHRSGVNPTDWKARAGSGMPVAPGVAQTPGHDGAGVVEAAGDGVGDALVGLRVWVWGAAAGRPYGTAGDYTVVPAHQALTLPDSAGDDLGASLGVPFVTAHRCLTVLEDGPRQLGPGTLAGRTVLVAGGAGAVGNATIQLARWSDATVISTVSSPAKALLAAAAGSDHVIDYRTRDVAAEVRAIAPHGVDVIVEVDLAHNAATDAAVLGGNGAVACYGGDPESLATLPVRALMMINGRFQFVLLYTMPYGAAQRALIDIGAAVVDRAVQVGEEHGLPLHHFPLEDAAAAQDAVQGGAVGKVLIDIT